MTIFENLFQKLVVKLSFWNTTNNLVTPDKNNEARKLYEAAIEDVKYNGPHIGNSKVPFQIGAIRNLLAYSGPYSLNEDDKEKLRFYVQVAGQCNGGRLSGRRGIVPGAVQGRQAPMIQMLENYKNKAT